MGFKGHRLAYKRPNKRFRRKGKSYRCAKCRKEMTLPFKPVQGRPVYCRSCFRKVTSQ